MKIILVLFSFFLGSAFQAHSFQTARQLSFAGSGSLSPHGVDSLNLNPATLSLQAGFSFGGGYNFGDISEGSENTAYFAWFKDSVSSAFPTKRNKKIQKNIGGLTGFPVAAAFVFSDFEIEDQNSQSLLEFKNYTVGLSTLVAKRMSIGLTVDYFDGASGPSFRDSFFNVDVGLLYWLSPRIKIGLSGLDILTSTDVELLEEFNPQRLRLSAAYTLMQAFEVYADVERFLSGELEGDNDFGAGLEASLKEYLSFRLGLFKRQSADDVDFGLGLSFMGPKLQIHYGFRQNNGTDTFLNSVDFSMPLW
jgi:hypothetical protein